jgi:hypothetical protein
MTVIAIVLVERLFAELPISFLSLASMIMKTRLTGSSTVARTLAFSVIASSGELHWHKEAEWAYMLAGHARTTLLDADGHVSGFPPRMAGGPGMPRA